MAELRTEMRIEQHRIKKGNPYYDMLDDFCYRAKNLYNHANFVVKSNLFPEQVEGEEHIEGRWIRTFELDKILHDDTEFPDYTNMPSAQSAQQLLKVVDQNWKSYLNALKDWKKNPQKYLGKPKMPKFLKKNGRCNLTLTNQQCKIRNDVLVFPKVYNGLTLNTQCQKNERFVSLRQVRIIPKRNYIKFEVVYSVSVPELKPDNGKYLSIDLGINNFATLTSNIPIQPILINGRGVKSVNQFYNKETARLQSIARNINGIKKNTKRMNAILEHRNSRVDDFMHKASRYVVDYAVNNDINTIVVGVSKLSKQKVDLGDKENQTFVQIPYQSFIDKLTYKAQSAGISVVIVDEAYTSGTSFLDREEPTEENYNIDRRIFRGLFITNTGIKINSDVNASYQILKKAFAKAYDYSDMQAIEGVAVRPKKINVSEM